MFPESPELNHTFHLCPEMRCLDLTSASNSCQAKIKNGLKRSSIKLLKQLDMGLLSEYPALTIFL